MLQTVDVRRMFSKASTQSGAFFLQHLVFFVVVVVVLSVFVTFCSNSIVNCATDSVVLDSIFRLMFLR